MAIDFRIGTKIIKSLNVAAAPATNISPYPYIGVVKNNLDPTRSGRMQVYVPELGGDPDDPSNWQTVSYASPYMGHTSTEINQADTPDTNNTFTSVSHSYGMWMVPPDIGVEVIVLFIAGDPMRGYFIACVNSNLSHHMLPGIASSKNIDLTGASANTKASYSPGDQVPVVEFNENITANKTNPNFYNAPKPVHETQYALLKQQGLEKDPVRGTTSSSSQRETPSHVFGISTPGRPTNDPADDPNYTNKLNLGILTEDYYRVKSRKGGHTFVMDDGATLGQDQLIRLRTAGGHQFLMHDTEETIYVGHANGNSWVELTKDGSVNLYSHGGFNLRSEGDINFHSDGNINLNADKQLNLHAKKISNVAATYSLPDTTFRSNTRTWNSANNQLNSITTVAPTHEPFNRTSLVNTSELLGSIFVDTNQLITANVVMSGYVNLSNTILTSSIITANVGMVGYVGAVVSAANIGMVGYVGATVSTANIGIIGYINQANTIQQNNINSLANSLQTLSNVVGNISSGITTNGNIVAGGYLFSNATGAIGSPIATNQIGISPAYQYYAMNGNLLLPSGTGDVRIFNANVFLSSNTTYEFEVAFAVHRNITVVASTSLQFNLGQNLTGVVGTNWVNYNFFAGNASPGNYGGQIVGGTPEAGNTIAGWGNVLSNVTFTAASTGSASDIWALIKGTIITSTAGWVSPRVAYTVAPGGVSYVQGGSYMKIAAVGVGSGGSANVVIGTWA